MSLRAFELNVIVNLRTFFLTWNVISECLIESRHNFK